MKNTGALTAREVVPGPPPAPTAASSAGNQLCFRELVLRLLDARDDERTHLARFLHDEVAQFLSGIGLQIDILRMDLEAEAPRVARRAAEIQSILERIVGRVRVFSTEIDPDLVTRVGLRAAVVLLVERARQKFSGKIRFQPDDLLRVPLGVAISMHRIAEAALENAVMHSGAGEILVFLRQSRAGALLEVSDDGRGFDPAAVRAQPRGLGLFLIEHHAGRSGLHLTVTGRPGRGAKVKVVLRTEFEVGDELSGSTSRRSATRRPNRTKSGGSPEKRRQGLQRRPGG